MCISTADLLVYLYPFPLEIKPTSFFYFQFCQINLLLFFPVVLQYSLYITLKPILSFSSSHIWVHCVSSELISILHEDAMGPFLWTEFIEFIKS